MVPNFALDLSEDGIVLLHRLPDGAGWASVAEVALDSPDLPTELRGLRGIAEGLEGSDFKTKLVLPPSQLLYASVPTGHDVQGDVERALESRTPYAIDDLAYDIRGTSPEVQVVAVARETLREAEAFIEPYELNAVGFTASPDQSLFTGEPNLGLTTLGETLGFETDLDPVIAFDPDAEGSEIATPETPEEEHPAEIDAEDAQEAAAQSETDEDADAAQDSDEDAAPDAEPEAKLETDLEVKAENEPQSAPEVEPEPEAEMDATAAADMAEPEHDAAIDDDADQSAELDADDDTRDEDTRDDDRNSPQTDDADAPLPAAFSSRRNSADADPETTGERVTKLSARMSVPDKAPKLAGAKPKPFTKQPAVKPIKVPPPITKGAQKTPPPVIPVARKTPPSTEPQTTGSFAAAGSAMASRLAARKAKKAALETKKQPDPIAALAAKQATGKPKHLGLILTLLLLAALGLFAVLSSYLLPETAIARFFQSDEPESIETSFAPETNAGTNAETGSEITDEEAADIELASLPSEPFNEAEPEFIAPPEPLVTEETPEIVIAPPPAQMTIDDAQTAYAVSGIWQKAPDLDNAISAETLDALYIASLDRVTRFEDAPALAAFPSDTTDVLQVNPVPPPPPDARFAFDERGLIRPAPQGALNPEGVLIFAGRPPIAAIPRPENLVPEAAPEVDERLAGIRPAQRPNNLVETQERANLGGLSRDELASLRPAQRPQSAQAAAEARAEAIAAALAETEAEQREAAEIAEAQEAEAEAEADPTASATKLAIATSRKPASRPRNFSRVVRSTQQAQARRAASQEQESAATQSASASTAAGASRGSGPAVARASRTNPTGPTTATVARAATDNNALALGRVSLVGVFGTSKSRRALVRMPNGRFKKVSVGDRVDGGRVAAIGSDDLRYTKGGRTVTLKMPKG